MTNREMITAYNGLFGIQEIERNYAAQTGDKLFKGRMRVTYAIKKNMDELLNKLKTYESSREELLNEYRDTDAEKKAAEELRHNIIKSKEGTAAYEKEKETYRRKAENLGIIMKEGKAQSEYELALNELLDINVEDISIHKISIDLLDGIELDSHELGPLMFMIRE